MHAELHQETVLLLHKPVTWLDGRQPHELPCIVEGGAQALGAQLTGAQVQPRLRQGEGGDGRGLG